MRERQDQLERRPDRGRLVSTTPHPQKPQCRLRTASPGGAKKALTLLALKFLFCESAAVSQSLDAFQHLNLACDRCLRGEWALEKGAVFGCFRLSFDKPRLSPARSSPGASLGIRSSCPVASPMIGSRKACPRGKTAHAKAIIHMRPVRPPNRLRPKITHR